MFKKFMVAVVISATSVSAFAAQDIYLTFKDGRQAVYTNVPDSVDNDQFAKMVMRDYGKDFNTDLDLSKTRIEEVADVADAEVKTAFWDSGWGTVAKVAIVVVGLGVLWKLSAPISKGCANTWDIAKDGSRCGMRAASVRPGGR